MVPPEQPGAGAVVRAREETVRGGGGGQVASPIGRTGTDIIAEMVDGLVMDDAGNLRELTALVAPERPTAEATTTVVAVAPG